MQDFTPEELDVLRQILAAHPGGGDQPASEPSHLPTDLMATQVETRTPDSKPIAPPPSLNAPYEAQAAKYGAKADALEAQAAVPMRQPQTMKERVIAGLQAGMQDFGRLGVPGGSTGQAALRQKQFDEENKTRLEQAKALRESGQQQQDLGQRTVSQDASNDVAKRNATVNEGNLKETGLLRGIQDREQGLRERVANRPVLDNNAPGTSSFGRNPDTLQKIPGTEENTPAVAKPKDMQHMILDVNGKKEVWAVDMATGTPEHKIGNAPRDESASGGMQIVQGTNGPDGAPSYMRISQKGPEGPVQVGGQTVGLKPSEAPAQLKNQADSAEVTTQMATIVRNLVKSKPGLVGPASGRINELMLKFGGDPGGIVAAANGMPPGAEKDAALLAGHLAYLFLNEARATMPGRPASAYMDFVKERSAAISQSPQIIEGFLQSAENNANIIKQLSKQSGYAPWEKGVTPAPVGGNNPGSQVGSGNVMKFDNKGNRIQ